MLPNSRPLSRVEAKTLRSCKTKPAKRINLTQTTSRETLPQTLTCKPVPELRISEASQDRLQSMQPKPHFFALEPIPKAALLPATNNKHHLRVAGVESPRILGGFNLTATSDSSSTQHSRNHPEVYPLENKRSSTVMDFKRQRTFAVNSHHSRDSCSSNS